jgi:hypothetical protein
MIIERWSPSRLNKFKNDLGMFILEDIFGEKQPVGVPAHRGTAVEDGVTAGLNGEDIDACVQIAFRKYDTLTALMADPRREKYRKTIPRMVESALDELGEYGKPSATQGAVEWHPPDLKYPIFGKFDYRWEEHGIVLDLKTTDKMPSSIKDDHALQVAFYAVATGDNADARLTYVTPSQRATYRLENVREHLAVLHATAVRAEKFIALSDDPNFFTSIIAPNFGSFYWNNPAARQAGFEKWGY